MASTYTASLRFNLQGLGDNINTWGLILNSGVFQLVDTSIAGRYGFTLSGNATLTSVNGGVDQSRNAILDVTGGTGGTLTISAVSKLYYVKNASTGGVTVTCGAGSATVESGEASFVMCDGGNVTKLLPKGFPTPANGTDAANKAYVDGIAFQTTGALPGINPGTAGLFVGNNGTTAFWTSPFPTLVSGKFLTNNGTTTSWATAGFGGYRNLATTGSITLADVEKLVVCSGTFTLTFDAASTCPQPFGTYVKNNGTGDITLARSGSDTIDGLTTYIIYPGEMRLFTSDGAGAWTSYILAPFYKVLTSTGGFVKPPGYQLFEGMLWAAGGSGAASGTAFMGGGGGAAGIPFKLFPSVLSATTVATIAAAPAAGADGSSSVFGPVSAFGGAAGQGVGSGDTKGGGGGGAFSVGTLALGGSPVSTGVDQDGFGGGGPGIPPTAPGKSAYGGGGGGGVSGAAVISAGGASVYGGGGGSGGVAGTNPATLPGGTSMFGGVGGIGGTISVAATNGTAPGGGGGGKGGLGARGELRIWGVV